MRRYNFISTIIAILILTSCGKADVQSACYSNGDHGNMSDGRITRICMCVSERITAQKLSDKETSWVIAIIEKDSIKVEDKDKARWREVSGIYKGIKQSCEALK